MNFISPNTKIISIPITPSGGSTPASTPIPTQQDLQDRKIIAIESYCSIDIDFDPENSGVDVLTPALFSNCFLTLYTSAVKNKAVKGDKQEPGLFYEKIPFPRMRCVQNNDTTLTPLVSNAFAPFLIRPTELAFNKCKIEFPTGITMGQKYSAVLMVHYLDLGDDGAWWMKAMGFDHKL